MNLELLTAEVAKVAKNAGNFIKKEALEFDRNKINVKSANQLVSYVDITAERMIVKSLAELLPEAGFITEEQTVANDKELDKEYYWVIDPLDGTTNFCFGLPIYSVSIGLLQRLKPVSAVVYEANMDETFTAWKGGKTYLNGREVRVNAEADIENTLMATGFPYFDYDKIENYFNAMRYFVQHTRGLRRFGSAAVDLAYVACGRFDGFFEYSLKPWDVAAGILLVECAGGKVSDFKGEDNAIFGGEMLAGSSAIHPKMLEVALANF